MKKCMKCGGVKMQKGGSAVNKLNKAKGFAKPTTGGSNAEMRIYGVPNAGPTGPNRQGIDTMQKGGPKKPTVKKLDDLTYKRDSTNYSNAANKYLNPKNTKEYNEGRDSLNAIKKRYGTPNALENKMQRTVGGYDIKKKGGPVKKMSKGGATSFGMLSVKAGVDKNPKATAADRIAGAKMSKKKMGGATKKKC